uniref:Cuticle protein 7 n=1 Tax=Timema shepardi TaxID=629360 RepID=A0A7R9FZ99_TIMSH|nr:unnamed protein product [Timema shepardi]
MPQLWHGGTDLNYSSPMASLVLTDSSQLTALKSYQTNLCIPTPNHMICKNMCLSAVTSDSQNVVLVSAVACALAKPGLVGSPLGYNGLAYGALGGYGAYGHGLGLGGIAPYGAGPLAYSGLASPIAYSGLASPVAYSGLASPVAYSGLAAPVAYAATAPAVAVGVRTQYHAQDELGQASYGHAEPFQTHNAVQDAHGNKIGSYSYVAPDGQVIKTDYVADGAGYRVASNALPVGPSVLPAPVHDTPEVVAARAAHLAEVAAVHSRSKRGVALGHLPASTGPLAVAAPLAVSPYSSVIAGPVVSPYSAISAYGVPALSPYSSINAYGVPALSPYSSINAYGVPAISAYAAPAVRAATLTTVVNNSVVNNPGHAVSYRVD